MVNAGSRVVFAPLGVAVLVGLAGLSLGRVYNGLLLPALVFGAAVGSALVASATRRVSASFAAPLSVLALAGYAMFCVRVSARSGGVSGDLVGLAVDAARNAVPRLLTALIPVEAQPDTVLAPVVLAWLATFAAVELGARARYPAAALVPPTLLYAGALVLVGPNAEVVLWQPMAYVSVCALVLVAAGAQSGVRGVSGIGAGLRAWLRLRTAAGLLVGVCAILLLVAAAAPLVTGGVTQLPNDPRRYISPPSLDLADQNPLSRISGWAGDPQAHLFDVEILSSTKPAPSATPSLPPTSAATPSPADTVLVEPEETQPVSPEPGGLEGSYDTRLRLAVLPAWDGVTWHMDAQFRSAGRVLPEPPAPPGPGLESGGPVAPPLSISERITVADLSGRLLPAVSAPRRVDGIRVAYDPGSGTLLHTDPLTTGVVYTVSSVNPSVDVTLLPVADVPSGPQVAQLLAVGDTVPADLAHLAEQISSGAGGSPYLRALALESFLADHYRFAADAPSGHAYPNLRFFLFEEPRAGGRRGTSEQFASAFAALGRLMGLPTRVVVGFTTPAGGGAVTAAHATAWPEVLFAGLGWVAFDPMPEPAEPPVPLEDQYLPKPTPPTTPPTSVEPSPVPSPSASAQVVVGTGGTGGTDLGTLAVITGAGLALLVVAGLWAIAFLRVARRQRRLHGGSPARRVIGAWQEVMDTLLLAGAPPPAHLAAEETAAYAAKVAATVPRIRAGGAHRPGPRAPSLSPLAGWVNAVGFSGIAAPVPGGADEQAAAAARAQALAYARVVRRGQRWWRRLLWRFDPRPLRRR